MARMWEGKNATWLFFYRPSASILSKLKKKSICLFGGFPDGSGGKESACNTGDPGSIPGSGRFAGEGIGYPLQYSWASLVAQLVKNPPARRETWVWSLGWEDPLEKGKATYSSILACTVHGVAKSKMQLSLTHSLIFVAYKPTNEAASGFKSRLCPFLVVKILG